MICRNCGNEMRDDARFCPNCGAMAGGSAPGTESGAAAPWESPTGTAGGGKKKIGLIIGAAVAAVAVIALLAVVVSGLLASPRGKVEKAFLKSAAAYAAAEKKLGLPDTQQWQKDREFTQYMGLELRDINSELVGYDLSSLNGLGLGMLASYSGQDRTLSFDLGAHWGEEDLLSLRMSVDDAEMYFSCPQLMGDVCYGVNTETMGADLAEMSGDDSMKDVSFNLFDLVDKALEKVDQEAMEKSFKEANRALWERTTVKKTGAKTLTVNGTETKTIVYQVVIPEEAMEAYVDDMADVLSGMDYYELYREMFQSMGMPQDELEDFLDELEDLDVYGELAEGIKDVIGEIGDVELEVCLSGGYVSAVLYEGRINGSDLEVSVLLGGGEEYVDDLSVAAELDGSVLEVKSTGDHGLKGGTYTDETTARVRSGGSTLARVTSDLTIDPKAKEDNFQWKLGVDSSGLSILVLEMEGDLSTDDDLLSLQSENVSIRAVGMEVCTLAFSYEMEHSASFEAVENPKLITRMDEQELMEMVLDTQERAAEWASDMENLFMTRLPQDLLWDLMYSF